MIEDVINDIKIVKAFAVATSFSWLFDNNWNNNWNTETITATNPWPVLFKIWKLGIL